MDTAGIDFGSTLVKAYWKKGKQDRFATADGLAAMPALTQEMQDDGVRRVRLTGIGGARFTSHMEEGFKVVPARAAAVDDEIRLQAAGTRLLMKLETGQAPRRLLIASVGTGVSYTKVSGRKAARSPLGSAHGGGTILGLGKIIGAKSFKELEDGASRGVPADLLVKDQLPETAGTMLGQLVIAHFWKDGASFEDRCASVFSFAAGSIAKDLAVLTSIPFSPKDIAVIGTVAASPVFRRCLECWTPFLKDCRLYFPEKGEYAAAVGAWADIST